MERRRSHLLRVMAEAGLALACVAGAASCLEPNPLLYCGDVWSAQVTGATYKDETTGRWRPIPNIVTSTGCRPPGDVEIYTNSNEYEYQALRAVAYHQCLEAAGTPENTCLESTSEVYHSAKCLQDANACGGGGPGADGGDEGETGGETSGGDEMGFARLEDGIACSGHSCEIQADTVSMVLEASPQTFAADGTVAWPAFDGAGRMKGFEIAGCRSENLGGLLGFENGDVVTELDDEPVRSVSELLTYGNRALENDELMVTVERDGQEFELRFERVYR